MTKAICINRKETEYLKPRKIQAEKNIRRKRIKALSYIQSNSKNGRFSPNIANSNKSVCDKLIDKIYSRCLIIINSDYSDSINSIPQHLISDQTNFGPKL